MNKETIKEWLSDIATPTGLSYSGDQTISNSMVEKIIEYVDELQRERDNYKNIVEDLTLQLKTTVLELMELVNKNFYWLMKDKFENAKDKMVSFKVMGNGDIKYYLEELEKESGK